MDKQHEESRKQFEEWLCKEYPWGTEALAASFWQGKHSSSDGYYIVGDQYDCLYWAYVGWTASRASIVVEIPDLERYYAGKAAHTRVYSAHAFRNDVEKNLRSIGLSIKGE